MALSVTNHKREFRFKKNGTTVKLDDPNPNFTPAQVMQFYAGQYPELTTATLESPKVEGSVVVHNATTTIGTKG